MKKSKKPSVMESRGVWTFSPVERIKESKRVYSRKGYKINNDME